LTKVTIYYGSGQTSSMYELHIVKTQVTKSRNIKIWKHEFICNLRFCDIILLFGTTCKSNTVRHDSCQSTILQYFHTLQNK